MRKKYSLTIDESMIVGSVDIKRFILDNIKPGEMTVASVVAKELGRNNNGSAWSKVFTRV